METVFTHPVVHALVIVVVFFLVMSLACFEVKSAELLQYVVKYGIHTTLTFDVNFLLSKLHLKLIGSGNTWSKQ